MTVLTLFLACSTPAPEASVVEPEPTEAPAPAAAAPEGGDDGVIEQMEACLHWSGEEPYDDERAKQIEENVAASCAPALARLREKGAAVAGSDAEAALLVDFLGHTAGEPGVAEIAATPGLCRRAAGHWKAALDADPSDTYHPYFAQVCPKEAAKVCGASGCQ